MRNQKKGNHPLSQIFKKNLVQVNDTVADILAISTIAIIVMLVLSKIGFFEFGRTYTYILVVVGAVVCLLPKCMVRLLPAEFMKYYMMFSAAVFILTSFLF